MTSSVRISELPTSNILNDDDFIIINTQNIVTQGIEAGDFITSLSSRDLTIPGDRTFTGVIICDSTVTLNSFLTVNDTTIFNGEVAFNGVTNLTLRGLTDVSAQSPDNGDVLIWDSGEFVTGTPSFNIPYLAVAPGVGPSNQGDVYINSNDNKLYVFNGLEWVATS